jgi:hypothetical protein
MDCHGDTESLKRGKPGKLKIESRKITKKKKLIARETWTRRGTR